MTACRDDSSLTVYRRMCVTGITLYVYDWNIAVCVWLCARRRSLLVSHWLGRKSYLGSLVRLKHCERRLITYPSSDVWPGRPKWTCVRRAMLQMAPLSIIPPLLVESAKVSKCSRKIPLFYQKVENMLDIPLFYHSVVSQIITIPLFYQEDLLRMFGLRYLEISVSPIIIIITK